MATHEAEHTEELVESELARFFTQSPDFLCIAGVDGYFKRLNPAWTTGLGWTLEELRARPFLDFVHPDDRDATRAEVAALAAGADTILFENRYRHRDGSYRWLRWNARPVPGRRRIYATARDVTRQKRLEREVIEIADREKEHLGRELHDGLCQNLAGIAALSWLLARQLKAGSAAGAGDAAAATEIAELLGEAINEARNLARGLAPLGLEVGGLEIELETLAESVCRLFRVSCTFRCGAPLPGLQLEHARHLFRIAQEAVHNAVTHGRAEGIEIEIGAEGEQGLLSIRDDGVGLPEERAERDGIGLRTMAYRARLIGGSLEVRRRAGTPAAGTPAARRGTVVLCTFPLPEPVESGDHGPENT